MFYFKLLLPALLLLVGATTTCLSQEEDDSVVEQTCSAGGTCKTVNADVEEESFKQEKPKLSCEDQHESCSDWANVGECTANPRYMNVCMVANNFRSSVSLPSKNTHTLPLSSNFSRTVEGLVNFVPTKCMSLYSRCNS